MTDDVDQKRRHFLTVATVVTGGVGIAFAVVPFISSLQPSAKALALGAPVEVPVGGLRCWRA
jgi:ubiquinol-cytochrome c reductase iron-sulfur subunit